MDTHIVYMCHVYNSALKISTKIDSFQHINCQLYKLSFE